MRIFERQLASTPHFDHGTYNEEKKNKIGVNHYYFCGIIMGVKAILKCRRSIKPRVYPFIHRTKVILVYFRNIRVSGLTRQKAHILY